ncbi:MarR family winged helix-turn-helix transcriptional regulator [Kocuria tytonis]|uniref:MarR family transcriptional regulator n=1 Tax=Kocuria tytonis TaxID=2054280 RepID=A0A495AAK4_9MICC|nr:MarR family winged helix-turn-helix transcriptional regulator [Kocuria tytonis]RKQ36470.1 MarR family transcriptional regulator [Kocuria tytonis]
MSVSHATAEELVRNLFDLQRVTRKVLKATAAHRELTVVQTNVLTLLTCVPGRRAKDIVADSNLGASGMSRQLAVLEDLGYVQRIPDPQDGRAQLVDITPAGRRALESNLRSDAESLVDRLADLSEEEAARTSADLGRLTELFSASLGMSPLTAALPTVAGDPAPTFDPPHPGAPGEPGRGEETRP